MNQYSKILELWSSYKIETEADLDKYLDSFYILFAYNSCKMENTEITYQDTKEIFENGKVSNYTGNPQTLFEQQNQKLCYDWLKSKLVNKEPLSIELIKEIYRILLSGVYDEKRYIVNEERPGEFKKNDYFIGINEVGLQADEVEEYLIDLVKEVNEYNGKNILKAATYFHLKFQYIHPFAEGNKRVGRMLLNYYLIIKGHPPLIIYEEDKIEYNKCLDIYDEDEEIEPLFLFLKKETEKTWEKSLINKSTDITKRKRLSDLE